MLSILAVVVVLVATSHGQGGWPCEQIGYNLTGTFCWEGGVAVCKNGILSGNFTWCPSLKCFGGQCVSRCNTMGRNLTGVLCLFPNQMSKILLECSDGVDTNVTYCPIGCRYGKCIQLAPTPFWSSISGISILVGIVFGIGIFGTIIWTVYAHLKARHEENYVQVDRDGGSEN